MADQFSHSVELGLNLAKRISYGKDFDRPAPAVMNRECDPAAPTHIPAGPTLYAVVTEPEMVENPDIPSYQPYVYGKCDPPALIPLHMLGISMEVDCYLDTAFVTVAGTWRLHCITAGKNCDCRIAIPMGERGSILGVQVESSTTSFSTQLVKLEEDGQQNEKAKAKAKEGIILKGHIYTLKVPEVSGGSTISVRMSWCQKLMYQDNQFCLNVPFSFPTYVNAIGKKKTKSERIHLNVNCGSGLQILCKSSSHPLKVVNRKAGKLEFSYEMVVQTWSANDFGFLYCVSSNDVFGSVLLQSPSLLDFDQREMFCVYLYPGNVSEMKYFKKEIVILVDISASMRGRPLDHTKSAVLAALSKLNPEDSFNVIAFNGDSLLFSPTLVPATKDAIGNANQWIDNIVVGVGGTNILLPLSQALKMFPKSKNSISFVFLVTDGSVEDEREICHFVKQQVGDGGLNSPRICTFGIGSYCNHYFLQVLAQIGRGYYDAAFDVDSINIRLERLFDQASSVILADISISGLEDLDLDSLELYPIYLPDLSNGCPFIMSGRFHGKFPESVTLEGTLADSSKLFVIANVEKTKDVPLEKMLTKTHIDAVTANAWLSENKQLEEKVAKMSLQTGFSSEYTSMILVETGKEKQTVEKIVTLLRHSGIGFGNLKATAENLAPETAEPKLHETSEMLLKVATNLCGKMVDKCCCMCAIRFCGMLNDQCAIVFTQLCTALACFGCMKFCAEICGDCECDFCC